MRLMEILTGTITTMVDFSPRNQRPILGGKLIYKKYMRLILSQLKVVPTVVLSALIILLSRYFSMMIALRIPMNMA